MLGDILNFSMFSTKYRFLRLFIFTPTRSYRHTASVLQIILFLHVNEHPFKDFYIENKYLVSEMKKALYQDLNVQGRQFSIVQQQDLMFMQLRTRSISSMRKEHISNTDFD